MMGFRLNLKNMGSQNASDEMSQDKCSINTAEELIDPEAIYFLL